MMKNKLILFLVFLTPFASLAQNDDLELWSSVKFSKKVSSKFRFELQEQIRWEDSFRQYQKNFTDLGLKYKVLKGQSLGLNVRFVNEFEQEKYLRMNLDLNSEYELKNSPIILEQRVRLQQSWDAMGEPNKTHLRGKWAVGLKTKFLNPYLSHEVYWKMAAINELSKKRSTLGVSWSLIDKLKMKVFLRSQKEFNRKKPQQVQIIGFGIHYKL